MGVYIWSRLPSAYQEVEYIGSSGTNGSSGQYINTGIIPEPANTVVKLRTMPTSSSYSIYLCSCMVNKGTAQTNYYYGLSFTANRWHCGYGTADTTPGHPLVDFSYTWNWGNTIYDVEYRNDDLYVNNTLVANATTNVSNFQYPMFLFARNNGGTAGVFSSFKLYSCEIYKSGTLVRNFVPCYRKSDSVIGLYDLANNQFYTNSGSGTFTKGSDVDTYRESLLKNAYIGEVYEYSYDFRNKTSAQVTADGYVTGAGTPAYNSNGFTSSNSSVARINKNIESLANAKKITLSFTVVLGSGSTGTGIRLMGANRTYGTGVLFDVNSNLCQYFIGGDKVTDSSGLSSGNHTTTVVLNLTNKTAVFSRTGKTDYSTSITDTQISNIKNNITLSEIFAGMSAGAISNWYLLVE